jgi:U4/U6 small nuclear ribonucleoprotein PRP4
LGSEDGKDGHGPRWSHSSNICHDFLPKRVREFDFLCQTLKKAHFNFCSYQVATGAGDDTIRIWDMRAIKSIYTIPAHVSNVSDVRFFHANDIYFKHVPSDVTMSGIDEAETKPDAPEKEYATAQEEWRYRSGLFFASAGYDGFVKLWSADDWQLLKRLSTDAGKVMSVDISSDGSMLVSGTYNRNFQLFAPEDA